MPPLKTSRANVDSLENQVKARSMPRSNVARGESQAGGRAARRNLASTLAQLQQAKRAREAQAATQLGYTKIYAPIDGVVSVRVAKQGEVVAQGSPIVVDRGRGSPVGARRRRGKLHRSIQFGRQLRVQLALRRHY